MALWSFVQGMERAVQDKADVQARLIASARAASTPAQNVLASAEQVARAVASLPAVSGIKPQCSQILQAVKRKLEFLSNISRLDASGKIVCAASQATIGLMTRDPQAWAGLASRDRFVVGGRSVSRVTHQPIILGMYPLHDTAGAFQGAIGIVIDVRWLDFMMRANTLPSGSIVALFDNSGTIIASNGTDVARSLFHDGARIAAGDAQLRKGKDVRGNTWMFATHALLGDNVYVGFAMRESALFGATYLHVATDLLLPLLMISLSWLAVWFITERQLTRWIIYLRRISGAYRAGHYALKPALDAAPSEFRLLGDALSDMASSIQDRDRSLREAVAQKSLLVKEVHHRVKNNLQIVMSLLSLQAGRLTDSAAKDALAQARVRINALALVHRILYEIEDQQSVDVKTLLEQLAEQTSEGFGGDHRDIRVSVNAVSFRVSADVAVPLALFAVEALTNAFKHAFPAARRGGTIRVLFGKAGDGRLRLSVEDDGEGFETDSGDASIGARLIKTFGQQLGGDVSVHSSREYGTIAELTFPLPLGQDR
ncbi:MAG: sensor histidine kinase [Rhizomicrobium sp.]|jgi:two-component sensor histidine kinase